MAIVDELIAVLGYEIRGEQAAKRYENSIDRLNNRLAAFSASAVRYGAVIGAAVGAGMGALGRSVIATSAEFEGYQATLETIEGSTEKAKASLGWITEFGKTTPYEVAGVTDAFVKLKAYGIDPIANDALRILGDTASAMNKPLNQAVEAFADAATGEFERLKEFGITSKSEGDKVTFAWTKNGKELTKTVKKNSEEIRKFLLETMGDRFSGAMKRQSNTWDGIMSNLGDIWTDFKKRIGDAGFFKTIKGYLKELLTYFEKLDKNGTLDRWAKNISLSLETALIEIVNFTNRMKRHFLFIRDSFGEFETPLRGLGVAIGLLLARLFPVTAVLLLAGLAVDDFLTYLQGGESKIGDFITWLQDITGVSDDVAQKITALGGTIAAALSFGLIMAPIKTMGVFKRVLIGGMLRLAPLLWAAAGLLFTPAGFIAAVVGLGAALVWYFWDDFKEAWKSLSTRVEELATALGNWFKNASWDQIMASVASPIIGYFWEDLKKAFKGLKDDTVALFSEIGDWIKEINWTGIGQSIMQSMWNGMKAIGEQIKAWFLSIVPDWAQEFFADGPGTQAAAGQSDKTTGKTVSDHKQTRLTDDAWDEKLRLQQWQNMQANLAKTGSSNAAEAVANDNRQDNRDQSMTNHIEIHQQVTEAAQAPAALARASGKAVAGGVAKQRSQIETDPAF